MSIVIYEGDIVVDNNRRYELDLNTIVSYKEYERVFRITKVSYKSDEYIFTICDHNYITCKAKIRSPYKDNIEDEYKGKDARGLFTLERDLEGEKFLRLLEIDIIGGVIK